MHKIGIALIGGFVALCFVLVAFSNVLAYMGFGADVPKTGLRQYISELYPNAQDIRVSCPRIDTDGDGYVRCQGVFVNAGHEQPIVAECATLFTLNSGCAAPKNMIMQNTD